MVDPALDLSPDPTFVAWWREGWQHVEADIALTLGVEPVAAQDDWVLLAMPFRPEIGQFTGVFSAGALIQLADIAAVTLCSRTATSRGYEGFPFTVQMSAQLVANTSGGKVFARAVPVTQGRSVMAAETRVTDQDGKLLLLLTTTHVVRAAASAPR